MERSIENIAGGKLQIIFTLTPEEVARFEAKALKTLAKEVNFPGFRPGNAPAEAVKQRFGPEAVRHEVRLQAAQEFYPAFVKNQGLETIGPPEVEDIDGPNLGFRVTVATLPKVELGKWEKIRVKRQLVTVAEAEVEKILQDIKDSRAAEAAVARAAKLGDRVEIDFEVSMGGVVIDGGQGSKYPVVLGKKQLIPGFEEQVAGMQAGEEKKFELTFPADYRKDLAGKPANVKTKLLQVFERTLPELTDELVRGLGRFESVEDLKKKLKQNLLDEGTAHEEQRVERDLFEALVQAAHFGELPEILLTSELDKMLHEFKHSLEDRGVAVADYLQNIKKDEASLRQELAPQAEKRVRIALLTRTFAKQESLTADELAVEQEIAHTLEHYGSDPRMVAQVNTEDYRDYTRHILTNRRVVEWLKKKLVE